jgi:hypothetical protein
MNIILAGKFWLKGYVCMQSNVSLLSSVMEPELARKTEKAVSSLTRQVFCKKPKVY